MRRGVAVWMGCALLVAGVAVASPRNDQDLTNDELQAELAHNRAMAAYVKRNGPPDLAETHFLSDRPPWDEYEVTLYYFDMHKQISFARAWVLGRPEVALERNERTLTDAEIAELASRARRAPKPMDPKATDPTAMAPTAMAPTATDPTAMAATGQMGPGARAEAAAQRAEDAADRVEAAAVVAERAADRAEAVVSKMESAPHRSRSADRAGAVVSKTESAPHSSLPN